MNALKQIQLFAGLTMMTIALAAITAMSGCATDTTDQKVGEDQDHGQSQTQQMYQGRRPANYGHQVY